MHRISGGDCEQLRLADVAIGEGDNPLRWDIPRVFAGCPDVVLYYRPGTAGWSAEFEGHPTALGIRLAVAAPSLTLGGTLEVAVSGPAHSTVRLQRSADLVD